MSANQIIAISVGLLVVVGIVFLFEFVRRRYSISIRPKFRRRDSYPEDRYPSPYPAPRQTYPVAPPAAFPRPAPLPPRPPAQTFLPPQLSSFRPRPPRSFFQSEADRVAEEKQQKFLKIASIAFHYVDEVRVRNFYNDYFKEPDLEDFISNVMEGIREDHLASIPDYIRSQSRRDIRKWINSVKLPDTTLSGMFIRFQREAIINDEVILGIEDADIEFSILEEFDRIMEHMANKFDLHLDTETLEKYQSQLKEKAAESTLIKLEKSTGWVLVDGNFLVNITDGGDYKCTYIHPVNEFLSKRNTPVTISITISPNTLDDRMAKKYGEAIGKEIPLKIYGNIWQQLNRSKETWEVQIIPLAIY